jgi:ribonucleoside-diphosphate reductase alpha chain
MVTTIAPTGTLSILANVNSGIEPYFALAFERKITAGTFQEVQSTLLDVLKEKGIYSKELIQQIIENEGKLRSLDDLPDDLRRVFPTAMEVTPEWHVRMQAAWQENIDSSISKTVNLPYEATVQDVENIYLLAYELGVKSITVYRDKSLDLQVLNAPSTTPKESHVEESGETIKPKRIFPKRPEVLTGFTKKFRTGTGTLYVTVNVDENGRPIEVFTNASGSVAPAEIEAIARLVSIALQYGIPLDDIVDQLVQPVDPVSYKLSPEGLRSTAHGIALALQEAVSKGLNILGNGLKSATPLFSLGLDEEKKETHTHSATPKLDKEQVDTMKAIYGDARVQEILSSMGITLCPVCGTPMVNAEGCLTCPNCGYSKCG